MKKKFLFALIPTLLLVACGGSGEQSSTFSSIDITSIEEQSSEQSSIIESSIDLGEIAISNENYFHYFGRHEKLNEGIRFRFTGCGFEMKINVTSERNIFSIDVSSSCSAFHYAKTIIDDEETSLSSIMNTTNKIDLFSNLTVGEHIVRFIKLNEVGSSITVCDFTSYGLEILPHAGYQKRMEVYGDSITCGYGNLATTYDSFSNETEDATYTYGYLAAKQLGYDHSIVSQSGISVAMNAFNSTYFFSNLLDDYVDFQDYPLDYAVFNLGTNDNTKFATYDKQTQEVEVEKFYTAYCALVDRVLEYNPDCKFIFCYNMMTTFQGYLETALQGVCNHIDDGEEEQAFLLCFTPDYGGADGHPGKDAHIKNGKILADFIKEIDDE